jgi:hypothetical protein
VNSNSDLAHVVAATHASGCFASSLNGGKKEANQDADDRNDDQQFNQSKSGTPIFSMGVLNFTLQGFPVLHFDGNSSRRHRFHGHQIYSSK